VSEHNIDWPIVMMLETGVFILFLFRPMTASCSC